MKMNADKKSQFKTALFAYLEGMCAYCGKPMKFRESTIDHIKPLAKGGTWAKTNLTLSHKNCNRIKGCVVIPVEILNDKPRLHKLFQTNQIGKYVHEMHVARMGTMIESK